MESHARSEHIFRVGFQAQVASVRPHDSVLVPGAVPEDLGASRSFDDASASGVDISSFRSGTYSINCRLQRLLGKGVEGLCTPRGYPVTPSGRYCRRNRWPSRPTL